MTKIIFGQKCIVYDKKEKKILILERSNYKQKEENKNLGEDGYFDMIGGKVDFQEDSKTSIIREAKEECNLILKNPKIIDLHSRAVNNNEDFFIFALYFCDEFDGEIKLSNEHKSYKWIPIEEIDNYKFRETLNKVMNIIKIYILNIN